MRLLTTDERLEAEVQRATMAFYRALGCQVIRFSEGRRTHVTPGWPDLACFLPAKRTMWLHEVKRAGGIQSAEQSTMQELAESCDVTYLIGGVQAAHNHLRTLGVVR